MMHRVQRENDFLLGNNADHNFIDPLAMFASYAAKLSRAFARVAVILLAVILLTAI